MKTLIFDVMLNGRFICTLFYKYCPLFRDKVIDEAGNVGWLSRIVPHHTPSEKYMRATLDLIFFFYMEEKDGTRAKHDVYTYGRPTKL